MVSAYSVPKSKRQQKIPLIPGPGEYNPEHKQQVVKKSDPKYSFPKNNRTEGASLVPGPGSYQNKEHFVLDKNPSYTILGKKDIKQDRIVVGPGSYDPMLDKIKQKSPAYSLKGRSQSVIETKPGPGQYEIKYDQVKQDLDGNKSYQFGKDSRNKNSKQYIPGPGSYEYEEAELYGSKHNPSYGFRLKIQEKNLNNVPGPGHYEGKVRVLSKIGGIISRDMHSSMVLSKTPGVGNYDTLKDPTTQKLPSWSISRSKRDSEGNTSPIGPGAYQIDQNYKSLFNSNPKYKFGNSQKIKYDINNVPGPGQYEGGLLKSRKSIVINKQKNDLKAQNIPGPGAYEFDQNKAWNEGKSRYSIGRSSRDGLGDNKIPGPGSYHYMKSSGGGLSFTKEQRLRNLNSNSPGPGQYDLKPHFADVPKYLLPDKK